MTKSPGFGMQQDAEGNWHATIPVPAQAVFGLPKLDPNYESAAEYWVREAEEARTQLERAREKVGSAIKVIEQVADILDQAAAMVHGKGSDDLRKLSRYYREKLTPEWRATLSIEKDADSSESNPRALKGDTG